MRIVNFHGVGRPRRELETGEARYWIDEQRFADILDRIMADPERDLIAITFDDGNISDISIALPHLERRRLTAQFFVLAGRIGEPGSLGRADIRDLVDAGVEIGSHGVRHVDWTSLSPAELRQELKASMEVIEDAVGCPVRKAAIPFGRYNGAVLRALRSTGYLEAFSSDGGTASDHDFPKPRTSVASDMSMFAIDEMLSGRMPVTRRLRRWAGTTAKHWL